MLLQEIYRIGSLWERRWSPIPMRFWFRGVDDANHTLDPGLLRPPYVRDDLEQVEYDISHDFRIRGRPYWPIQPQNSWEELFLMQHYGFPTRLLDWTESLAAAAYFAARDVRSTVDGAVWALSPQWLVYKEKGEYATHLFAGHEWLKPYELRTTRTNLDEFNKHVPLPLIPEHIDARIIAQRGRFTIHTFCTNALEDLGTEDRRTYGDACFLHQIRIPARAKPTIRQQALMFGGACEDTLFPDLEGLARSMRWEAIERATGAT